MKKSPARSGESLSRRFFIGVEVVLAVSWIGLLGLNGKLSDICFATLGIAIVILLFVLPWFWRSLRHIALLGWLLGAGSVVLLAAFSPGHR